MKKIWIILLVMMIFGFAACTKSVTEVPPNHEVDNSSSNNPVVDPQPNGESVAILLYYMNREYIQTGDDQLEKMITVEKEVTVGEKTVEEMILAELQKTPEDQKLSTSLGGIKILSVETVENTAYVNLSGEKLYGGSLDEICILSQIVFSLTELPEIEQVQILVDGSKRETLMGHIFIEEPLTREDL